MTKLLNRSDINQFDGDRTVSLSRKALRSTNYILGSSTSRHWYSYDNIRVENYSIAIASWNGRRTASGAALCFSNERKSRQVRTCFLLPRHLYLGRTILLVIIASRFLHSLLCVHNARGWHIKRVPYDIINVTKTNWRYEKGWTDTWMF